METSKSDKINDQVNDQINDQVNPDVASVTEHQDLRQSPGWAKYLSWLGWKSVLTTSGVNIEFMRFGKWSLVKIQRPPILSSKDLEEIGVLCKKESALFIKIEPLSFQDLTVLENAGYVISVTPLAPPSTIYVDLTKNETGLWHDISKSGRYSIRRAGKEGVTVTFDRNPSPEKLQDFYDVLKETSRRQKFLIQSFADLRKKAEIFGEDAILVLGYDKDGGLLGGKFFVAHENTVWYLHAGTNTVGRSSDAGHKMMWESFRYFKKQGYSRLDMDGIDDDRFPSFTKKWGGFSYFKEKFGGEIVRFPYPHIKYLNPFLKFLARGRALPL